MISFCIDYVHANILQLLLKTVFPYNENWGVDILILENWIILNLWWYQHVF